VICCLSLTGCGGSKVIENLAILEAVSFDQSDSNDNPIKTTVLFPTVSKEGMAGTQFLSASGKSSHETFVNLQNLTNLKLVGG
ncbi:Ger(x)C family spore germination protein, partial [Pseudomonas sp. FW305-BF6]|uniref:Ger(x)C family spore germination protein n=1 Tax=Pseudomonas sp. FW305-BF6 TaxID=2070673 RepID=UPI001C44DC08